MMMKLLVWPVIFIAVGTVAGGVVPAAAPAGLQANWTFAEGGGAIAGDASGNGQDIVLQNGASFSSGRVGLGLQLDGVNDFVALPANSNLVRNASGATLAAWVKLSSYPASGAFREVISISVNDPNGAPTNTSRAALAIKGDGSRADVFAGARSTDSEAQQGLTADLNLVTGTWTHLVATFSFPDDSVRVYMNGSLAASATVAFSANSSPDTPSTNGALGAQDRGDGNFLHSAMDEVRVYNRALSDAEVQALATGDTLQAHWKLDDGSGLVASDASGNLHTGTLKNGLETGWIAGGQVAGALQFDGVDDYVQVDAPGILQNVNSATVATWIKPSSTIPAGSFRELISISVGGAPSDVSRFALALRGDGTAGDVFLGGRASDSETQKSITHDSSLPVGEWVHVAGVANFSQGTLEIYINGLLATSGPVAFVQPATSNSGSPSIALGAQDSGGSNRYAGAMDEVRVYGRALTACEVQELAGRDGLQAYWKFDESSGTTAADSSATGLTATLKNGASFVPGKLGNALDLDGVDDYADMGLSLPILKGANAGTVAAWINLSSVPASGAFREIVSVAVGGSPSNTSRLALAIKGAGAGTADLFVGGRSTDTEAQQTLSAVAGIQPGVWRHVAATLDVGHNQIRVYLDGSQIASANVAFSQPTTPTTAPANGAVGAQDLGNSNWNHAKLDEVRIYCRVLSAAEIASLAASAAPAAPVLSLVEEGNQQVKLSWTPVPGADFYNVKRSTTQGSGYVTIASPGGTTHTDLGLTNGVTYYYVVTAQNAAGSSPDSNEIPAMPRDAVPPAPVIVSPASGAILATATPTVSGSSSAVGLTITLLVDGSPNGTTISGVAGNWSLTPATLLAEGLHNLTATAASGAGTSLASSPPVSIRIDTVAPIISSPQPPDGSSTTNSTSTISASWNDPVPGSGIDTASAVIKLDNVPVSAALNATGFSFTPSPLALGSHTVSAQVSDLAGNPSALHTWAFSVVAAPTDTTPPVISNLVPPNGSFINNPRPQLSASISDSGGSGINPGSVVMALNSIVVSATVTLQDANNGSVTFIPNFNLGEGQNAFSVNASDGAGNVAATGTSTFTTDFIPPVLSIVTPANGASFTVNTVDVQISISDPGSGVNSATVQVTLNGDTVNGLTVTPGEPTTVTGILLTVAGTQGLVVSASDRAGNSGTASSTFTSSASIGLEGNVADRSVALEIISGSGQSGVTNECAPNPLVIRAYDPNDSTRGVPGLKLYYNPLAGGGFPILDRFGTYVTDQSGRVELKYVLGPVPGPQRIEVGVVGREDVTPVEFTLTAQNPSIQELIPPSPCNPRVSTHDFRGSALPKLFRIKATKPDGSPLRNETIEPIVSKFEGEPTNLQIGTFMPTRARTNSNGEATFAFVIDLNSPIGAFTMTFALPRYRDANGDQVGLDIEGEVLDPSTRDQDEPIINHLPPSTSGQGQIGLGEQELQFALRAKITSEISPKIIEFSIIEGAGSFRFLPSNEGRFFGNDANACGPTWLIDATNSDGKASIMFTLASGYTHALIAINRLGTDVFAVGPPESRLIQAANQDEETRGFLSDSVEAPDLASQFLLETWLPISFSGAVTAQVESLDLCDNPLPTMEGAVAPSKLENISLSPGDTDPLNRFRRYRSSNPIDGFGQVIPLWHPRPTFGGNIKPLQVVNGCRLEITYNAGGFVFLDTRKQETSTRRYSLFGVVGETLKVEVGPLARTEPKLPAANTYKWTIELNDVNPVPARPDGSRHLENAKSSILLIKLSPTAQSLDKAGTEDASAITLKVDENKDTANRRAQLKVKVEITGTGKNPPELLIPIALSKSRLDSEGAPFNAGANGEDELSAVVDLQANYAFYTQDNEGNYYNFADSRDALNRQFKVFGFQPKKRIGYSKIQSANAGKDATASGLWRVNPAFGALGGGVGTTAPTFTEIGTTGPVVFPAALKLIRADLDLLMDFHEVLHDRDIGFKAHAGTASVIFGLRYDEIWKDFVKAALDQETETERIDRKEDYAQAALRLMAVLSEVECYSVQLEKSKDTGSYNLANTAAYQLTKHYNEAMNYLKFGMSGERKPGEVWPTHVIGKKLSATMTTTIVRALAGDANANPPKKGVWDMIPAYLFKMKGDTKNFNTDFTVLIVPGQDIWRTSIDKFEIP